MPILLSGGGDPGQVIPLDAYFADAIDKTKPVLYSPVAMEPSAFSYAECLAWFTGVYAGYGIDKVEMCTDLSRAELDERYSAVFIGGGNTFKLLNEVKASGFDRRIQAYLNNGGFLYGGSAGAILCGKTIETAAHADENSLELTDLTGLNLLNGYDIWCHYAEEQGALIEAYPRELYILYEESGLLLEDGEVKGVGKPFITRETP